MLFYNLTEPLRRARKNWDMRSSFCSVFIFTVQNIRKYQCFKADYRPIKRLKIRPQEGGPGSKFCLVLTESDMPFLFSPPLFRPLHSWVKLGNTCQFRQFELEIELITRPSCEFAGGWWKELHIPWQQAAPSFKEYGFPPMSPLQEGSGTQPFMAIHVRIASSLSMKHQIFIPCALYLFRYDSSSPSTIIEER